MNVEGTVCQGVKCIQLIQDGVQRCLSKLPYKGRTVQQPESNQQLKNCSVWG